MTERGLSQVHAAEMGLSRRFLGLTLRDKVCSYENRKSLNVDHLLFRTGRSQIRLFGHMTKTL